MQGTSASSEQRSSTWLLLLCVFAAAILVRQTMWRLNTKDFDADPDGYRRIAETFNEYGMYGVQPASAPGPQPTAFRPPLYPLLVAACCLFEGGEMSLLGAAQVVLGAATVALTFWLALTWGLPRRGAVLAAAFVTFDPILLKQSVLVMTETLAAFLAVASLCLLTALGNRPTLARSFATGACLGLCVLCRPTFLIWAEICAVGLLSIVPGSRRRLAIGAMFVLGLALLLSPWVVRNYRVFGRPIATTTHGGFTLWLANNPYFFAHLRKQSWLTPWPGPNTEPPTNEVERDREHYAQARAAIRAEPGMFLAACCYRLTRLWGVCPMATDPAESEVHRWLRYLVAGGYALELALAAFGAACVVGRDWLKSPWLWGLLLVLSFTAVHTFYWTDMRMRAPLASVIALAAAAALARPGFRHVSQPVAGPPVRPSELGHNLP
jgi:hypothetical protein